MLFSYLSSLLRGRDGGKKRHVLATCKHAFLLLILTITLLPSLPPSPPSSTQEKATDLHVEDGSSKGASFNVRVISDSLAYALAVKQSWKIHSKISLLTLSLSLPPSSFLTQEKATDLYVEDGSSKGAAFNVRVISDSPAYALAAKAVLDQAQTNSSSWPFAKNVIVYAAGGAKTFAGVMFAGGKAGEVTGKEGGEGGREK